jgi:hypothetical protein
MSEVLSTEKLVGAGNQWLMLVILATQEVGIRRSRFEANLGI